jgi:NAD+ kinase
MDVTGTSVPIRNVLLIVNLLKDDAQSCIDAIASYMVKRGIGFQVIGYNGEAPRAEIRPADLAISLGGDGTILYSVRLLHGMNIPILAVNLGRVGFITEVAKEEWQEAFEEYESGKLGISERLVLRVEVRRGGRTIAVFYGLNDAVITASGISKIIRLRISLSGTPLGEYHADGVIVATPTGSTAYAAAAGGPILDVDMSALVITPICPYTLANRTLVVEGSHTVEAEILPVQRTEIAVTVDGQVLTALCPGDLLLFTKAEEKALLIRSGRRNFFEVLRAKLNWSGGSDA